MADVSLPTLKRPNEEQQAYVPAETPMDTIRKGFQALASSTTAPAAIPLAPPRPPAMPLPANSGRGDTSTPIGRLAEQYGPRIASENGVDVVRMAAPAVPAAPAAPAPTPAALPQASYSNEGRVTNKDIVMPPAPAAPKAAPLPTMEPASRTPVSDSYSGPAAGMVNPNVTPTSGVEDGMRQLQNIRALSDMTPQGGVGVLNDPNADATKAWNDRLSMEDLISQAKTNPAAVQALVGTLHNQGQAASDASKLQAHQLETGAKAKIADQVNTTQLRGQTLQHGLGMRHVDATERGQNLGAATAEKQIAATRVGQDLQHDAALQQVGATLQGQKTAAETAAANIEANKAVHAATNLTSKQVAQIAASAGLQQRRYVNTNYGTFDAETGRYLPPPEKPKK